MALLAEAAVHRQFTPTGPMRYHSARRINSGTIVLEFVTTEPNSITMRFTRTYDKLIATIRTRRSAGSLRSPFGAVLANTVSQVTG